MKMLEKSAKNAITCPERTEQILWFSLLAVQTANGVISNIRSSLARVDKKIIASFSTRFPQIHRAVNVREKKKQ